MRTSWRRRRIRPRVREPSGTLPRRHDRVGSPPREALARRRRWARGRRRCSWPSSAAAPAAPGRSIPTTSCRPRPSASATPAAVAGGPARHAPARGLDRLARLREPASRASRSRSSSPTARPGAAPAAWPTSRPATPVDAATRLRGREHQQDVHGRPDPRPRRGGQRRPRRTRPPSTCRSCSIDRQDHGPPAARPHERAARLLLRPRDRQGAAARPGPASGRRRARSSTSASPTSSRARAGTTRTRTTCARAARRARRRGAAGRPAARRASSSRSASTTRSSRRGGAGRPGRARLPLRSAPSSKLPADRPVATARTSCRSPRSSPRPARPGSIASTADGPRPLGAGALRRRRPRPGLASRRWSATSRGPRRTSPSSRTASASRRSTIDGHPTLGHSGRLLGFRSVVRWLPDRAHRDRGADQPEPDGPARHRAVAAQARPDAADPCCVDCTSRADATTGHAATGTSG